MGMLLDQIKNDRNRMRLEKARSTKAAPSPIDDHMIASLTTLYSDAQQVGFDDGKRESTDAEVIQVIKKTIKGLNERLTAQYDDYIHTELCYLNDYLPIQLTASELEDYTRDYLIRNPNAKMGQIMGYFKANHDGQYDGKLLSQVVKGVLS